MTMLDCNVSSCVYNESSKCCRNSIEVKGQDAKEASATCCGSYNKSGCGCTNSTKETKEHVDISCEATHCKYNENNNCVAEHVGVKGGTATAMCDTQCNTFRC